MFMLFAPKEKGQGLVEYAIIIALIAIVVIAIMMTLGQKVNSTFNSMSNSLTL
jgi:pilus assembly protein Flp/PilA